MNWRIGRYPDSVWNFEQWTERKYPHFVEGTPEYFKSIATNCYYCGREMKQGTATIDHFIPKSKGGTNDLKFNRYVICCETCNRAKGGMRPEKFLKEIRKKMIFGGTVGDIDPKRLQKVYDSLSKVVNDFSIYNVKTPIYYRMQNVKRKREVFFKKAV